MANAECEEHTTEWLLLRFLEFIEDFRRGFRTDGNRVADINSALGIACRIEASRIERRDVFHRQFVEVGHVAHQAGFQHLVDDLFTQAVDVHASAAYPV